MAPQLRLLTFRPILVPKPWGGRALARFGKDLPRDVLVGESWELADLPDGTAVDATETHSHVVGGPHDGWTLSHLISTYGTRFLGSAPPTPEGYFPLLLKLLDADENLSVQVHPDEAYVAEHPATWLKTESWYVLDARPGAVLYIGFRPGVTFGDVESAVGTRALVEFLQPFDARPGDFHHLPAGTVHALGAGVVVAETQTPSDTTFRMYDWTEEYSRAPRTLHVTQALETLKLVAETDTFLPASESEGTRLLITTDHYWQREHQSDGDTIELHPVHELRVLMVTNGTIHTRVGQAETETYPVGSTILIPASVVGKTTVKAGSSTVVLEIGLVDAPR
ncbi:putative mannose-6-phosphate isomerase YvyI [bacterium BMS3Bbin02]|nr:putative mannose-6-phosphate isomerase YvyI [bacterium BMS3Bbin02]